MWGRSEGTVENILCANRQVHEAEKIVGCLGDVSSRMESINCCSGISSHKKDLWGQPFNFPIEDNGKRRDMYQDFDAKK